MQNKRELTCPFVDPCPLRQGSAKDPPRNPRERVAETTNEPCLIVSSRRPRSESLMSERGRKMALPTKAELSPELKSHLNQGTLQNNPADQQLTRPSQYDYSLTNLDELCCNTTSIPYISEPPLRPLQISRPCKLTASGSGKLQQ